jgi:exosortase A
MMATRLLRSWPAALVAVGVLLALLVLCYRDTLLFVAGNWNQWANGEYYAHGYLALAIALYLIFRQRGALAGLQPCPAVPVLPAVAAAGLLWLVAALADVLLVQVIALWLLILTVTWALLGGTVTRLLLFPLLLLVFALPVWSPLPPLLQELTTDVVFWMTRLAGVPALRQEQLIVLPAGRLSIDESCSGLSYLLAALTLGMLYGYLSYRRLWARVLVMLIAAAAAIVANFLRVFIVVYVAYESDMQNSLVYEHFTLGWILFGVLVGLLLGIDVWLSRYIDPAAGTDPDPSGAAPGCRQGYRRWGLVLTVMAALVAGPPLLASRLLAGDLPVGKDQPELPAGLAGWSGPLASEDGWMPVYHGAMVQRRSYRRDAQAVQLFLGYYPAQRQGRELIYALNRISDDVTWSQLYAHPHERRVGDQWVLEQELIDAEGHKRLVWYWYHVAGQQTVNRYAAKLLQVLGLLTGRQQAGVVAVATDIDAEPAAARRVLSEFLASMQRPLQRLFAVGIFTEHGGL